MTIFESDENFGLKVFSKGLENTVEKGKIVCHEKFLLFPYCYQTTCTTDTCVYVYIWDIPSLQEPQSASSKNILGSECRINSLPDDKIIDWFKLKQITDDILKSI